MRKRKLKRNFVMVPDYPDQSTRTSTDDTGLTNSGSTIIITGRANTDISSITDFLSQRMQNVGIAVEDLANAIIKVFATPIKQSDIILKFKKFNEYLNENIRKEKKVHCYFLPFVLFLVAFKGLLPHPCRDIRNDETPYGFG